MILVLLAILVSIVPFESSFVNGDYKVKNDYCEYSEVKLQPFEEITNPSLRSFLLSKLGAIANTACVQSYQVKTNNDSSPFYVFRIDRQTRFLRSFSVCGVVTVNDDNFMWTSCNNAKFRNYLMKCESEDGPEARHSQVPPVPSCNQTPIPVPVSPSSEVTPPTPAPRVNPPNKNIPPTPAPRLNPPNKVTPPTPAPRVDPPNKGVPPTPAPRLSPPNKVTPPTPAPRVNPPNKGVPPTPAPRLNPPNKVTPPTPAPRVNPPNKGVPPTPASRNLTPL